jgi:TatD DNase family protein
MCQWTDSHAHLYSCDNAGLCALISAARDRGVHRILNAAVSLSTSQTIVRQCAQHPGLVGAAGISPFDIGNAPDSWEETLAGYLDAPGIIAVGETGIDATNPSYPDFNMQISFFEKHLKLAFDRDLPVIVHSRGCERKALDICINAGITRAVFHCYTGPLEVMKKIIDAGFLVSFSGIITFPKTSLVSIAAAAPTDVILVETDTPYLAPVPYRGKTNQPAWVVEVGKTMARIKKMSAEDFASAVEKNFDRLFCASKRKGPS